MNRKELAILLHNNRYNCCQTVACTFANEIRMYKNPLFNEDTYKLSKDILKSFEIKNSSIIHSALKGINTRKVLRSCHDCITDTVMIAERVLQP